MKGKVIKYFPDKGFGFLKLEDGNDCYFHKSKIEGEVEHIYPGDVAEVECRESRKKSGSFEAVSLEIKPKEKLTKFVHHLPTDDKFAEGLVTTVYPERGYGFVSTVGYHDVYFSFRTIIGDIIPERDHLVLLTVRASSKKPGTYEASSLLCPENFHFADLISESDSQMSELSFHICVLLLQSKDFLSKDSIVSNELSAFFNKLNEEQKLIAFKLWLNSELDYYDETFIKEVYDSLDTYDKLRSISRSQKISLDIAFNQLDEVQKEQLFNDCLEVRKKLDMKEFWTSDYGRTLNIPDIKITGFLSLNYLRTKFSQLKFIDIYSVLIPEKSSEKKGILIEYLLQTPHNEYSDEELDIVFEVLDNYYQLEKETIKSIYESIHDKLRYPQKQKMLDKFLNSKSELFEAGFLLSEINRLTLSEQILIAEKVDQSTRLSIFETMINLIKEGSLPHIDELLLVLKEFKSYNKKDLVEVLISVIYEKLAPEDKYQLWKHNLTDYIDQDLLIKHLRFTSPNELAKAFKHLDSSLHSRIIDETLRCYSEINQQNIYNEVSSALNELIEVHFRYLYPLEIINKYLDELYDRSSQEFKDEWFLDGFISKVKLSTIEEELRTYDSYKFTRFVDELALHERIEFSKIIIALYVSNKVDVTYDWVISVIDIFNNHDQLQFEVISQILTVVNDDIKLALMQSIPTNFISDELYRTRLEILLEHSDTYSIDFNSFLVFSALYRECSEDIAGKLLKMHAEYKELLLILKTLLKEGFCYFSSGKYEGTSVLEVRERDWYYRNFNMLRYSSDANQINRLAREDTETIEAVGNRISKFFSLDLIPLLENIRFKCDHFLHDLDEILSIIVKIKAETWYALSSVDGLLLALDISLYSFIKAYHTRIYGEVTNTDNIDLLRIYGKDFYLLKALYDKNANKSILSDSIELKELLEMSSQEFLNGVKHHIEKLLATRKTFSECIEEIEKFIDKDEYTIIHLQWLREFFYESCDSLIISELQEYQTINSYQKYLKLQGIIKEFKPRIEKLFPKNICPYIEGLENIRAQTIRDFIINGPIKAYTQRRYERFVAFIGEIKKSYDESQTNELINLIHSYCDDEFQLRLWFHEIVDIFDFERYAMVYFTLTREERRKFNKRVREIIKVDLDKKLLAVRVPWKLVKKEGNETVYEATWRSVWFQDGAIRFCMDEGIFSTPYNLSFARKDFNSIYSFLSGKRGGDLTVYCINDSIVDVQGLDELKELIQRVIITRGLTESNNFLFKSEGENRVPVNLLLKNECMNVLSKLVGEGIKVHRVYEKIWKVEHGISVPFNFDISYIFPVPVSDGTYVLLWESARLEKSKATYVFSCQHDQLDEYLEKLSLYIDRQVNVRSAILTSTKVQNDLGFSGRIEHENFDIFPWKKRLVSYLPGYSDKIFESTEAEL